MDVNIQGGYFISFVQVCWDICILVPRSLLWFGLTVVLTLKTLIWSWEGRMGIQLLVWSKLCKDVILFFQSSQRIFCTCWVSCRFASLALSRACGAIPLHVMDRPRSLPFWVNGMSMLLIVIGRGVSLAADIICNLVLLVLIFQLFSNWLIDEMALWVWRVIIIFDLLG